MYFMKHLLVFVIIIVLLSNITRFQGDKTTTQTFGGTQLATIKVEETVNEHIHQIDKLRHKDALSDSYLNKSAKYAKRFFWEIDSRRSPKNASRVQQKLVSELYKALFFVPNDMKRERTIHNHINLIRRLTQHSLYNTFGTPFDTIGFRASNDIIS